MFSVNNSDNTVIENCLAYFPGIQINPYEQNVTSFNFFELQNFLASQMNN